MDQKMNNTRVNRYFVADLHFGHANILTFEDRRYKNVEDMNEGIIKIWNSTIQSNDVVYVVGDVGFLNVEQGRYIISRLNGHKVLVLGNHDDGHAKMEKMGFAAVVNGLEIELCKKKFKLCHYPYWTFKDWWNKYILGMKITHFDRRAKKGEEDVLIHGHVHSNWPKWNKDKTMINVSWDAWKRPVSLSEIISILEKK
jgi:calcineurin-like phosphoesterase family protein